MTGDPPVAPPPIAAAGSIYDLGYRRYEGPRLGRGHAIRSLFLHSLASTFGIGRGGRAKIAPLAFGGLAILPAVAYVGILVLAAQMGVGNRFVEGAPIGYDTYFSAISQIVVLFCAAQAPELFGRDQRHGVLALYFARALRRSDYALARLAGFVTALLIVQLVPQLVLFLGRVLLSPDIVDGIVHDLPDLAPVFAQGLLSSALLGGLSMTVAAFTPRRAYATAGIIALFVLPSLVAGVVTELGSSDIGNWLSLLSPMTVLEGTNVVLFGSSFGPDFFFVGVPAVGYFVAALAGIAGAGAITVRRFARLST